MDILHEFTVSMLLLVGSFFILVGAIRLHAPTKATTMGVGGMLLASMAWSLAGDPSLKELLITLFLFVTAPVSAHLLARAALNLRLGSRAPLPRQCQDGVGTREG
jgi:multicomponent K+:H+ antiporter subunit G